MKYFKKLSLKLRLTLLFVFIFTGSMAVFSYFIFQERMENRAAEFDANLFNYAIDIAESLDIDSYGEVEFNPGIIKLNEKIFPFSQGKSFISVMDINGKVVAHSQVLVRSKLDDFDETVVYKVLKKGVSYSSIKNRMGQSFRVIHYLLPVLKIDSPLILQIVVPTTSIEISRIKLKNFLISSLSIILFIGFFVGYAFMSRALKPMIEITNKTKQIEFKNLQNRVPVPESQDEIRDLALTINLLLQRLQLSFETQERFVQDASHQLKTPLAIMKGELEIFNSSKRNEIETNNFLESISQELNSLIKLTNDLLILARVDSGESNLALSTFQIDEILLSQVSRLSKLAHAKSVAINIEIDGLDNQQGTDYKAFVDPELIGVLFYNFIENAIKYSSVNSEIKIAINIIDNMIVVSVKDFGNGIRPGLEEKIFERFYRSEFSGNTTGSGLGLAICKAVAKLHHAEIWAKNNESTNGSTFYFKMKALNPKGSS